MNIYEEQKKWENLIESMNINEDDDDDDYEDDGYEEDDEYDDEHWDDPIPDHFDSIEDVVKAINYVAGADPYNNSLDEFVMCDTNDEEYNTPRKLNDWIIEYTRSGLQCYRVDFGAGENYYMAFPGKWMEYIKDNEQLRRIPFVPVYINDDIPHDSDQE